MAMDCVLPELGENIDTATVVEVFVAVGAVIEREQPLLSLETDKAEFELPSPLAGRVSELLVAVGEEVRVGQVILRVEDAVAGDAPRSVPPEPTAQREEGARAAEGGTGSARPARQRREKTEPATETPPPSEVKSGGSATREEPATGSDATPVAAAPSVRRLARALGVELAAVGASGKGGRVLADDVHRYVRERLAAAGRGPTPALGGELPDFAQWGPVHAEPMSKVRRRTAEQMSRAWATIPHVTHHDAADVSELDRLRKQYAKRVEEAGGKLTMTAVLLKVVGSALKRYPKFNASVDMDGSTILYKDYVNVGVAVDTERGLLVPVIRDVDRKNIVEIALALREVSERARGRNITPDMLQGATFTITNLGGIGGTAFSPLINPPEVAVLGASRARTDAAYVDGELMPRLLLPLAVTYDHRIIDGADAARFLRWVCEALEEPFVMDLEGQ